jgi:hypothetical protein
METSTDGTPIPERLKVINSWVTWCVVCQLFDFKHEHGKYQS